VPESSPRRKNIPPGNAIEKHIAYYDQHNLEETDADNARLFFDQGPVYTLEMIHDVLPYMKEKHYGKILICASGAGISYVENACSYSMAKSAMISLSRTAAHELGQYGITTNCFLPVARTDSFEDPDSPGGKKYLAMMEQAIPIHHFGTPYEDVSPMVAFLASDKSNYVNGQVISICGGCCNPV
jgi:3-oxoacyl-[acyl-carrier protein] reductase